MRISLESPSGFSVAELREVKVHGLPGIGGYTLVLILHFTGNRPRAETYLRNISIRVEWGDNTQSMLGTAIPDCLQPIRVTEFSSDIQIGFRLHLSAAQIEDIEKRRNGGEFKFGIWLFGELEQESETNSIYGKSEFSIRQQDWIEALQRMEYRNTMLFELPVPNPDSPVGEIVNKAQAFLYKGEYDHAVILCRQAIEKTEGLVGDKSAVNRAVIKYRDNRKEMDPTERLLFVREALKNATHVAVHHTENHYGYSREQAKAILATTIALLSCYLSDMKVFVDCEDDLCAET